MKRAWWIVALIAVIELGLILSRPQWATLEMRTIYEGLWTLTGITDHPHRFQ